MQKKSSAAQNLEFACASCAPPKSFAAEDILTLHAEEPNMAHQFEESLLADLVHTVFIYLYMLPFRFDAITKKLFSLPCFFCFCFCFVLFCFLFFGSCFFCLAVVGVQVNTENIQYL